MSPIWARKKEPLKVHFPKKTLCKKMTSKEVKEVKVVMTSKNDADHTFKVVIIGESGIGKTALLQRFAEEKYEERYLATIGVDFAVRTIEMQNKRLRLMIWDTCGSERYHTIALTYYRSANGILLVYEVGNRESLEALEFWLEEAETKTNSSMHATSNTSFVNVNSNLTDYSGKPIIVLVGTKSDKVDKSDSITEVNLAADKFAQKYGIPHVQCSAKTDTNVNEVFGTLTKELIKEINSASTPVTSEKTKTGVELVSPSTTKAGKCCH